MENVRRYALYVALAVVSYLLLQAWNTDYGQTINTAPQQQSQLPSSVPDAPGSTMNSTTDADEVPPVGQSTSVQPTATESTGSNRYVHVKTDVLELNIDLNGGDIEYLALPKYPQSLETPDVPFILLEDDSTRKFVVKSGLFLGTHSEGRGEFTSSSSNYTMTGESLDVVLSYTANDITYDKIFHFRKGDYLFDVSYRLTNNSDKPWEGSFYGEINRDKSADPSASKGMSFSSVLAFAWTTPDTRYEKVKFGDIDDGVAHLKNEGGWVAFLQHYFLTAWIPGKQDSNTYYFNKTSDNRYRGGFTGPTVSVAPGATGELTASIYSGPKIQQHLRQVADHLELSVDYSWLWWAAQPIFWLLTKIQSVVINWGWSIILLTICIKGLFYPLTASSYRSMAKMKKFAPKMQELREQYGEDRQKMSQELMKLYQKEKINPLGGCLPMVVQMPVFMALYWVLQEAVELRQSPWIFWIHDLSLKDPYFILPILMAGSMFLQMQMTTQANMDPMQAKMMKMMPLVFGVMFLWFPSGLVLYWLVNNLITIAQQWYINHQIAKADSKKATS
ncbi:membrane protein insertase YidC [Gynuella sp.]|uniref:membrane protein insertase YidC n=1 Tax=Gynuella sp. TaxID=2969146 RepID=UPI003D0BF383